MTKLIEVKPRDPRFRAYLRLASREWPWFGAVAIAATARPDTTVMVLEEQGEVVAGALLTGRPANLFRQGSQRALARRLCSEGRLNLSYFAVRRGRRGLGHGRRFVRAVAERRSFWLACDPTLDDFYHRCGLTTVPDDARFRVSPMESNGTR